MPPPQSVASGDGFQFRNATPNAGNFSFQNSSIRYTVERTVPADGLLGTHPHPFEPHDLGRYYGEGSYRVTKQEPGRPPQVADIQISQSYGKPRFGPSSREDQGRQSQGRFGRSWREADRSYEEEAPVPGAPRYQNPFYSRMGMGAQPPQQDNVGSQVATTVVTQMAEMHKRTLDQMKDERSSGPQGWMQQFFQSQQSEWSSMREAERQREDERRREERDREEKRRSDDQSRWERQQKEERDRHDRDMQRIEKDYEHRARIEREQRQTLLDLEQRKIDLLRDEHKNREAAMQKEIERSRSEMQTLIQKTQDQMQGVQDDVQERLDKERETIRREHELRQQALDNEHKLRTEILKVREENAQRGDYDAITRTIEKIVGEVGKNIKEVVELKKLEVLTPEAQAAAVHQQQGRGGEEGNVVGDDPSSSVVMPQRRPRLDETAPPPPAVPEANGNGDAPKTPQARALKMDKLIQEQLKSPFLKEILREWALHVEEGCVPTTFANMYMEWMKDPKDDEGRKATAAFANYMQPRSWKRIWPVIKGALDAKEDADIIAAFETPAAEEFYTAFKAMVCNAVSDWWESYLQQTQERAVRGGASAAPEAPAPPEASPTPAPPPPPEPPRSSEMEEVPAEAEAEQ